MGVRKMVACNAMRDIPHERSLFCDKEEHRMYRVMKTTCPCFRDKFPLEAIPRTCGPIQPRDCEKPVCEIRAYESGVYFITEEGMAYNIGHLFEKLQRQEDIIVLLQEEVKKLKEKS